MKLWHGFIISYIICNSIWFCAMAFTPANLQNFKSNESFLPPWYFRSCYFVTSLCNINKIFVSKKCKHFLTIEWSWPLSAILILCCFFNIFFTFTLQVALDQYIEQMQQEIEEDTQLNILNIKTSYWDFIGVVYRWTWY